MRRKLLGAALFFFGLGILFAVCDPFESCFLKLAVSAVCMLLGLKIGGCC